MSAVKTSMGGADPEAFVYIAQKLKTAGRTAATFQTSAENVIRALENARTAIHGILQQYYLDREAEARWADDGGPCD